MAAELAQETAGEPTNKRIFLAWHAIEGAKLFLRSVQDWKFDAAAKILTSLLRQNSWLPVSFVRGFLLRDAVRSAIREDELRFGAARNLHDSTPIEHEVAGAQINGARSYLSEGSLR